MYIAVLGPLRVTRGDTDVTPTAPKQRSLLAALIVADKRTVSPDRLIAELWGHRPPDSYRNQLRWHAHQLRRALGDEAVLSHGADYSLVDDDVDARRFDRLRRQAASTPNDPARTSRLLTEALGLWRGEAYDGLADTGPIRSEAIRLEAARLSALEARIDADLRLGRHTALVIELERLVSEHPLQERFRAQLIRALHHSGRPAEALNVYRQGRRRCKTELGREPGPELRELERAILTGESRTADHPAAQPNPAALPPGRIEFTGRHEEVSAVAARLTDSGNAATPAVVVTGAAGTEKSALAIHVAHRIAPDFPDGRLYVDLSDTTTTEALQRLLGALGFTVDASMDVDELSARFRTITNGKRILLVLDNARDTAQVRPLLPGCPQCKVLVTSPHPLASIAGAAQHRLRPAARIPTPASRPAVSRPRQREDNAATTGARHDGYRTSSHAVAEGVRP